MIKQPRKVILSEHSFSSVLFMTGWQAKFSKRFPLMLVIRERSGEIKPPFLSTNEEMYVCPWLCTTLPCQSERNMQHLFPQRLISLWLQICNQHTCYHHNQNQRVLSWLVFVLLIINSGDIFTRTHCKSIMKHIQPTSPNITTHVKLIYWLTCIPVTYLAKALCSRRGTRERAGMSEGAHWNVAENICGLRTSFLTLLLVSEQLNLVFQTGVKKCDSDYISTRWQSYT